MVDAEYLRNADKINWVMSFKDVYHKFVDSYQRAGQKLVAGQARRNLADTENNDDVDDDLEMPCFYVRNQASIALFKIDAATCQPVAELIPSLNLAKLIKESLGPSMYTVLNIYEDDDNVDGAESDLITGRSRKTAANGKRD